ncbi:uncharacterized protein PAC_04554 [Phialocephala subalpina]|uniref:Chromo domain-containing protein n=1 Tax=Phialocephala subalpina TaxID=576137 RepID=A0A1L7WPG9_9HELO|nr:uncharacterized protein PAC_04554 [Phialocephala subalpina]
MPARFDDLPTEIQLNIFEIAAVVDFRPRVVEIFNKNGQIYSKTPPPPLLQVCHLSRHVVLKIYKPWLPQFKGTKRYQRYEKLVKRKDLDRLQNVCISLEHDLLVSKGLPDLGLIPRLYLRHLANDLHGRVELCDRATALAKFRSLRKIFLFDEDDKYGSLRFKYRRIKSSMAQMSKKGQAGEPGYLTPKLKHSRSLLSVIKKWPQDVRRPSNMEWSNLWIKYKYLKTFQPYDILDSPQVRPRARIAACNGYTLRRTSQNSRKRTRDQFEGGEAHSKVKTGPKCGIGRKDTTPSFENVVDITREDNLPIVPETLESPLRQFKIPLDGWDDEMPWIVEEVMAESADLIFPDGEAQFDSSQAGHMLFDSMQLDISPDEQLQEELASALPQPQDDDGVFIPERIMAKRDDGEGLEYLIKWENYPDEKDWTWEPKDNMLQDVPDLVRSWKQSKNESHVDTKAQAGTLEHVPEKIHRKKKIKGIERYHVQWVGYPREEEWTWERCERFSVDAPMLVQAFEAGRPKKRGRGRPRIQR